MRVAILGQSGPYAGEGIVALTSRLPAGCEVALVVEAPSSGPCGKRKPQRGLRWGFAQPQPIMRSNRKWWDLDQASRALFVPYVWCSDGDSARVKAAFVRARINVAVVLGCPFILSPSLRAAAGTVLNAHPSMLPRFRGAAPLFWWLRSGEPDTGVTVHAMTDHIDCGPILAQVPWSPPALATGERLWQLAGNVAGQALAQALARLATEGASAWAPGPIGSPASWAPRPRPEDGHVAPALWRARALLRFFAGAPHFVAVSFVLGGQRFFVSGRGAPPSLEPAPRALPGDFVQVGDRVWMAAKDGVVACDVQV